MLQIFTNTAFVMGITDCSNQTSLLPVVERVHLISKSMVKNSSGLDVCNSNLFIFHTVDYDLWTRLIKS